MATHEAALGVTRRNRASLLHGIYLIVNPSNAEFIERTERALDAGVRIVQYRAKAGIVPEHLHALRSLTARHRALLIVNDDWRAALAFDCDGVHVGPGDDGFSDVVALRRSIGDERLIGVSCGTVSEAQRVDASAVDYIGVGAVYATGSKPDAGAPIGLSGLAQVAAVTALPVAAIGGIDAARLAAVRSTGVAMAAVISAISTARDAGRAAAELTRLWREA